VSGSKTKMSRSGKVVGAREVEGNLTAETPVSLHHHNSMNSSQVDPFSGLGLSGLTMQKTSHKTSIGTGKNGKV
jgi:hypothetical protein